MRYLLITLTVFFRYDLFAQSLTPQVQTGPVPGWVQPFDYDTTHHLADVDIQGGVYLELFEEQHNLEDESAYHKVVRHITSEMGVQNASQISVSYAPSYQRLVFHSIRVLRQGKVINQLFPSKIKLVQDETDLERFIYSGIYTAYLVLDDIRPGDKIEYSYTLKGMNPVLNHQFGDFLYFSYSAPVSQMFISLVTAPGQKLHLRYFNEAPQASRLSSNNKTIYEWKLTDRPAYTAEDNEPPWYDGAPYAQISTDSEWKEVADWAADEMESVIAIKSTLVENKATEWNKEAGNDDFHYIQLATRFVQDQIRYMGIEMGPYSHRPHEPGQVLKQRYGDCKDKSLLLCAFLRLRHLQAHVALVNSYYGQHLQDYLPSALVFDHAIVTFEKDGKTYWIDPTISYQRGTIEDIATPDYGYALLVQKDENSLTRMTVSPKGKIEVLERFRLPEDNQQECILGVTTIYTGGQADDIRQWVKASSLADIQKSYRDYYNRLYKNVSLGDSLKLLDEPEKNQFTTIEQYRIKDAWTILDSVQQLRQFAAYAKFLQDRLPEVAEKDRKTPLSLSAGLNLHYRIQLIPPGDWTIRKSDEEINRDAYKYNFSTFKSGDTINLDYTYCTYEDHIPATSISVLDKDLDKISNDLTYTLTRNGMLLGGHKKPSRLALMIALIAVILFSLLAIKFYRYSLVGPEVSQEALPIGGWLILIAISLCISPLLLLYQIFRAGYFSESIWMTVLSKQYRSLYPVWGPLIGLEFTINIFLFIFSILLLLLFFHRRNTLPKAIIFLYVFRVVFLLADAYISNTFLPASVTAASQYSTLSGTIISACIWIPYFIYSQRVKQTFVYPFRKTEKLITTPPGEEISRSGPNENTGTLVQPGDETERRGNAETPEPFM